MADKTCEKCGKVFAHPSWLKKHRERKRPCTPIVDQSALPASEADKPHVCPYCGRRFTALTNMRRHVRNSCKIAPNDKNGTNGMDRLYEHTKRQQELLGEQGRQLEETRQQVKNLTDVISQLMATLSDAGPERPSLEAIQATGVNTTVIQQLHVTENNVTNVRNEVSLEQTNNVTVNVFGQERVDHITAPQIYQLLMNAKNTADPGVQALLDAALVVFSDPSKPENITCYLPNKKTSDALVHEETGWQIKPIETVLSPMVRKSLDVLFLKQPYGHEEGLPTAPDITACGEVLKLVAALESDPALSKKTTAPYGPLRTVLVRNKDVLARANGGALPPAGGE